MGYGRRYKDVEELKKELSGTVDVSPLQGS
jgi:hypothetical protein